MTTPAYYLGAPVWSCPHWVGSLYSTRDRKRWLREYSSVFTTVEGNSTFYGVPELDTFRRWADDASPGFRFCLKFPSVITHERELVGAERDTAGFLEALLVLQQADRLGPTLVQLPPHFAGDQLPDLAAYLDQLPKEIPIAVEVRHADYFDQGPNERALDQVLRQRGADRALFDSRALFSASATDPIEEVSQGRKPRSPYRTTITGGSPMVRFIGRNQIERVDPWIAEWADTVAGWVRDGLTPYLFTHAPDDTFAPAFAERFHAAMQQHLPELPDLPAWPSRAAPKQRSLF